MKPFSLVPVLEKKFKRFWFSFSFELKIVQYFSLVLVLEPTKTTLMASIVEAINY